MTKPNFHVHSICCCKAWVKVFLGLSKKLEKNDIVRGMPQTLAYGCIGMTQYRIRVGRFPNMDSRIPNMVLPNMEAGP